MSRRVAADPRFSSRYKRNRAIRLAQPDGDLCHLCGHRGARTIDHIVDVVAWWTMYGTYDGVNDIDNLAPAHGTEGRVNNRCPVCLKMCNQSKGRTPPPGVRSRVW